MRRFLADRQSLLIAMVMALALVGWMASATLGGAAPRPPEVEADDAPREPRPFAVRVAELEARSVSREVVIYGRTEPARGVTLRAEVDGRVVELGAERGSRVAAGDVVARVDARDREARLREAQAKVGQWELRYEAARRLEAQRLQSQAERAEAAAQLAAARAQVERVELEIAHTSIRAPFEGILERRPVEVGDYLRDGDEVARIIDTDPILVTGDVNQQELHHLQPGARGEARLITGQHLEGRVRFVASESDPTTRTFRIELEIPNPDGTLVSGATAEFRVATPTVQAHRMSAALLSLDGEGRMGIKTVDEEDRVTFRPVEILRSEGGAVWVTGLPDPARVIVLGQGFVHEGDRVTAVAVDASAAPDGLIP